MNRTFDMSDRCAGTSVDQNATPYEEWHGCFPSFERLLPLGTIGYMRNPTPAHKLSRRGVLDAPCLARPRTTRVACFLCAI